MASVLGAAAAALVLLLLLVERGPSGNRQLALVAALGSTAAAGRILFAFVPNVQPVTMLVAVTGVGLGARAGMAAGALAAVASNAVLGQGPWTPWQALGWALVGAAAALLRRPLRHRLALAGFGIACGFLFDWLLDVWSWSALGPGATAASFLSLVATGIPFDCAHAAGNAVLALVAGPTLVRMLERYARRLDATFAPLEQP